MEDGQGFGAGEETAGRRHMVDDHHVHWRTGPHREHRHDGVEEGREARSRPRGIAVGEQSTRQRDHEGHLLEESHGRSGHSTRGAGIGGGSLRGEDYNHEAGDVRSQNHREGQRDSRRRDDIRSASGIDSDRDLDALPAALGCQYISILDGRTYVTSAMHRTGVSLKSVLSSFSTAVRRSCMVSYSTKLDGVSCV
jgi:hypothetical protein